MALWIHIGQKYEWEMAMKVDEEKMNLPIFVYIK